MTTSDGDGEPACKRDSVAHSREPVAIHLCGPPGDVDRAGHPLLGLAPGGGYRAARVTPDAGALLPHRFTLTCATPSELEVCHRRSALCCPEPTGCPVLALASTL